MVPLCRIRGAFPGSCVLQKNGTHRAIATDRIRGRYPVASSFRNPSFWASSTCRQVYCTCRVLLLFKVGNVAELPERSAQRLTHVVLDARLWWMPLGERPGLARLTGNPEVLVRDACDDEQVERARQAAVLRDD